MVDDDLIPPEPPQDNVGGPDKQPKRKRGKSDPKKVKEPKVQTEPVPVIPPAEVGASRLPTFEPMSARPRVRQSVSTMRSRYTSPAIRNVFALFHHHIG
jgi:hypothetical protein